MDKLRFGSVLLLGILTASVSGLAMAAHGGRHGGGYYGHDHDHWGVGIVVDPFLFGPGYYPGPYFYPPYYSPYYYPPAVVTVPAEPSVYIERGENAAPAPRTSAYWYYCADPQGYYPDVKHCPGGWQAVPPRLPATPDEGR
jgi:hypothetical protein